MLSSKSPHITRQKKIEMMGLQSASSSSSSSSTETYAVSPSLSNSANSHDNSPAVVSFDFNKINIGTLNHSNERHYLDTSYDSSKLLNITSAKNNKQYTKSKSMTSDEVVSPRSVSPSTTTSYRDSRTTTSGNQSSFDHYEFVSANDHLLVAKDTLSKSTNHLTNFPNALTNKNKSNEQLNAAGSSPINIPASPVRTAAITTTTTTTTTTTSVSKEKFLQQLKQYQEQQKNGGNKASSSTLLSSSKLCTTTKSVPIGQQQPKQRRIFDLMRLSQQAGSFFSRSCPGEEMAQFVETPSAPSANTTGSANGSTSEIVENKLNDHSTSQQKFSTRTFLAFARTGKNGKKPQQQLSAPLDGSSASNSSSPSNSSSALSDHHNHNHHHFNHHKTNNNSSPKYGNSKSNSTMSMIGSYEVDLEKLARELVLPSMDAPLTSFKTNSNSSLSPDMSLSRANQLHPSNSSLAKPPLQTSKTLENSSTDKPVRKMFTRSLTQNK